MWNMGETANQFTVLIIPVNHSPINLFGLSAPPLLMISTSALGAVVRQLNTRFAAPSAESDPVKQERTIERFVTAS